MTWPGSGARGRRPARTGTARTSVGLRRALASVVVWGLVQPAAVRNPTPPSLPTARNDLAAAPQGPAPATASRVPFRPGETLTYDISWAAVLGAGTATLTVQEQRTPAGSPAYYIVAETRPGGLLGALYRVYYKADTLLDGESLLPQRGSFYSEERGRRRLRITRFDQSANRAEFEVRTATVAIRSLAVPSRSQDALSAVYVLRASPIAENTRLAMPVCDGGNNYMVQVAIGRIEPVDTAIGIVPAFRVTPTVLDERGRRVGRPLTLWISSDERRRPVKLRIDLAVGSIELVLRQAVL